MEPTGVNKILVEKYGYEWVNGKAWKPGTAPEPVSQPEPEPALTPISEPNSDPINTAKMFANFAFGQDDLDLNRIFQSNDTAVFYDDEYVTYGGETYQDVFAVGGNIFAGKNLIVSPSNAVTGGVVEGYLELLWNGTENVEYFGILNSEVPALDIYLAATTRDTTDDYEILSTLLSGDDLITLSPENDTARGLDGNDEMFGYSGADKLYGGNGNDNLDGGSGNDILYGDLGDDFLNGSFDDDIIYGGPGNDTLTGGAGEDTFVFNESSGHDTILDFSDDDDKIVFEKFTNSEVDGFPISANEEGFKVIQFDNDTTITFEGVQLTENINESFVNYPEPTGINKILVEKYGYEWVNGKAWKPGTAPEPEVTEQPEPTPALEPAPQPAPQPAPEPSSDGSNWETKYNQLLAQYQNLEAENAELKIDTTPFSQSDVDAAVASSVASISAELSERENELAAAEAELVEIKNNTQVVQAYDFDELFYDDFYNRKWTVDGETKTITWSTVDTVLKFGDQYFRTDANASNYLEEIRQAINLWDEQLESISFEETNNGNAADLAIGITYIDGPGGTFGQWHYYWEDGLITDSAIIIDTDMVSNTKFSGTLLHEIGNILGLGDIEQTDSIKSVQEEPLNAFSSDKLYPDDIAMIKQLYGEQHMLTDDETPFSQSDVDAAVAPFVALAAAAQADAAVALVAQAAAEKDAAEAITAQAAAEAKLAEAQINLAVKLTEYDALVASNAALQASYDALISPVISNDQTPSSGNESTSNASTFGSWEYAITTREMESNNTPMTSNALEQLEFSGQTYSSSDKDYYLLNVDWDVVELSFSSDHWDDHEVSIIDSLGITLASKAIRNDGTIVAKPYHEGNIYILVEGSDVDNEDYTISLKDGAGNYEMEPNNFAADADRLYNYAPIKGQSISESDEDYFIFTATSKVTNISFSSDHWDEHQVSILNGSEQIMAQSLIRNDGIVSSSTFIGQDYYVLVTGADVDQEEYVLTVSPDIA